MNVLLKNDSPKHLFETDEGRTFLKQQFLLEKG